MHLDENIHSDLVFDKHLSKSVESLKSISSETNSNYSSNLKMNNKHVNANLAGSSNKSLSRKSLTKLNNTSHVNENLVPANQQQQQLASCSSLINRKSNNSWIAQSFRKAFGKIENRRKNNQLNKSQIQLNKNLKAMSSTFSVNTNINDYEFMSTGGSSQRNSSSSAKTNQISTSSNCSESGCSKRSSLSDDENALPQSNYQYNARKQFLSNKLSLAPMSFHMALNDTECEDGTQNMMEMGNNKYQKNTQFAVTKRSYRSESELAKSVKHTVNNDNSQMKNNINCKNSINNKEDRKTYEPQATDRYSNGLLNNPTIIVNNKMPNNGSKLNKSVNSLLHAPNQNIEYNAQRIEELNQSYMINTSRIASQQPQQLQQPIQRSKTPINKISNTPNQILSINPNNKW